MATTPAADARSGDDRRLWIGGAIAVALLVSGFVLHAALNGRASTEQQIGEQVYAGAGCLTKVSSNQRVARRWPQASKAEVIVCQTSENDAFANHVMDYAQFESATALAAILETAPPHAAYCAIGSAVVTPGDPLSTFAAMCAHRGGTLHEGIARSHRRASSG